MGPYLVEWRRNRRYRRHSWDLPPQSRRTLSQWSDLPLLWYSTRSLAFVDIYKQKHENGIKESRNEEFYFSDSLDSLHEMSFIPLQPRLSPCEARLKQNVIKFQNSSFPSFLMFSLISHKIIIFILRLRKFPKCLVSLQAYLTQKANEMRQEQEDEIKHLNEVSDMSLYLSIYSCSLHCLLFFTR